METIIFSSKIFHKKVRHSPHANANKPDDSEILILMLRCLILRRRVYPRCHVIVRYCSYSSPKPRCEIVSVQPDRMLCPSGPVSETMPCRHCPGMATGTWHTLAAPCLSTCWPCLAGSDAIMVPFPQRFTLSWKAGSPNKKHIDPELHTPRHSTEIERSKIFDRMMRTS